VDPVARLLTHRDRAALAFVHDNEFQEDQVAGV